MSLENAINALKRKDFASTLALIVAMNEADYGIQHFLIKGLAESAMGHWAAARDTFARACQKFPTHAAFWFNRGVSEENLGLVADAITSQNECVRLNPTQVEAFGNLSNLYRKQKNFTQAEAMARQALQIAPENAEVMNSLGLALAAQGKFAEAENIYRKAHEAAPQDSKIIINQANLKVDQLCFDEAWGLFAAARAIDDKPVYRHHEALARLLADDFEKGWHLLESRLKIPGALRLIPPCPLWRGEDLTGKKLLILAEQGFGDMIQFCRYQEYISGGDLVWAVPKPLVRLLTGGLRGTVLDEKSILPVCDYYVPAMSLPLVTGYLKPQSATPSPAKTKDLPSGASPSFCFLSHVGERESNGAIYSYSPKLPEGKNKNKIGLVWAGSPTHERDHERSVPLKMLTPMINSVAADFYALQLGYALKELDSPAPRGRGMGGGGIIHLDHLINDFADTAALLKQLDCLVTVDTAVAHLAGTLGVKTYLLLSHCPDWRWGVSGETTELYPSVTLVRQPAYGDWESVIAKVKNLLESRF